MTRHARIILKFGLPILILAGAAGLTYYLVSQREAPEREDRETEAVLVETTPVERSSHRLDVRANGTVVPAREVNVSPRVAGRIEQLHPNLVPGGLVDKGEMLVRLEASDYRVALEQRKTALEQARAQLEIEKGQQNIAKQEWELFKEEIEDGEQASDLALRKPQLRNAKAQVDAAEAQVEKARMDLSRTTVRAPFDAVVLEEQADIGQLAGTQSRVARLVGTDAFWVRLSIPTDEINAIDIPGVNAEAGSEARITYDLGDRTVERTGEVVRLLGDLDRAGRMARVLVEIQDPFALEDTDETPNDLRGVPLLLNSFVDVKVEGNKERDLVKLPRRAVRDGTQAFVYEDGTLSVRELEIVGRRPDSVLVDEGLDDGDRVVISSIGTPVDGMELRLKDGSEQEASTASDPEDRGDGEAADEADDEGGSEDASTDGSDDDGGRR